VNPLEERLGHVLELQKGFSTEHCRRHFPNKALDLRCIPQLDNRNMTMSPPKFDSK
jgi:hypothetical protein